MESRAILSIFYEINITPINKDLINPIYKGPRLKESITKKNPDIKMMKWKLPQNLQF